MVSLDHCVAFRLLQSAVMNLTSEEDRAFPWDFKLLNSFKAGRLVCQKSKHDFSVLMTMGVTRHLTSQPQAAEEPPVPQSLMFPVTLQTQWTEAQQVT